MNPCAVSVCSEASRAAPWPGLLKCADRHRREGALEIFHFDGDLNRTPFGSLQVIALYSETKANAVDKCIWYKESIRFTGHQSSPPPPQTGNLYHPISFSSYQKVPSGPRLGFRDSTWRVTLSQCWLLAQGARVLPGHYRQ